MRIFDGERAQRPECAGHLEMRDHDHHAEQKRDGVEIDGAKRFLEAQGAKRDHRRTAEESDPGAVEAQAWNAARRNANIGQNEDDERSEVLGSHSPAAASIASGSLSRALARSSRVSGINKANTTQATAAAAPRARNEAE